MDLNEQKLWLQKNCNNGFETYRFPSSIASVKEGDEYIGEINDNKANGKGIYNWNKGFQYFGDWIDDNPHGNGILIYPDGRKYEGGFSNGKREGKGKLYWPNGDVYDGDFLRGKREGNAEFLFLNETTFFKGRYVENFSEGIGILKSKNGDIYKGDFKQGKRNGQGRYLWSDGRVYCGEFQNGNRTGLATSIKGITVKDVKDGSHPLVMGDISETVRKIGDDWIIYFQYKDNYLESSEIIAYRQADNWYNDIGVKICDIQFPYKNHKLLMDAADGKIGPLGNLYDGEWKNSKKHGKGKFSWISNDGVASYNGDWQLGNRTGKGIYVFKNGMKYEGDFVDNIRTGIGKMTYSSSFSEHRKEYDGEWQNNKRWGKGKMTWKTGEDIGANGNKRFFDSYFGEWKDDKQHGNGKMTYENPKSPKYDYGPIGGVYDGEWYNGERNGFGTFISQEGWTYDGLWKDGRRHGKGLMIYSNGKKEESIWINDAKGTTFKDQFEDFILRNKDVFDKNSDFLKIEIYFTNEHSLNLEYPQGQHKGDIIYNLDEICLGIQDFIIDFENIFENYFKKPCLGKKISSIYFSDRLEDGDVEFHREYHLQK